jgi:hypothetical protein
MQSKIVYQANEKDFFIHDVEIYKGESGEFVIPYRAYEDSPHPIPEGFCARRLGGVSGHWAIGEDHRRDALYVAGTATKYEIDHIEVADGVELVYGGFGPLPAWLSATAPEPSPPTPDELIKAEIAAIETEITARRMREAVLGLDAGWLATRNEEIAALRAQLQPQPAAAP